MGGGGRDWEKEVICVEIRPLLGWSWHITIDNLTVLVGPRPNSGSPSPQQRRPSPSAKREAAYVVQAGRLISKALLYEKEGEWDEAFDLLKAGVDILLNGVQSK